MTLDINDAPNEAEILKLKQGCRLRERMWRKRTANAFVATCLSCIAVIPFSAGEPFHSYATFGDLLVWLSLLLWLLVVYCGALWYGAWSLRRDVEKTYS